MTSANEDLPQDALDGGWTRAGLEAYGLQMKAQRDELLAALKLATECLRIWAPADAHITQFDALIAKAEGATP
jgi:hypothetical protein